MAQSGTFKFASDLFIGKNELNRFQEFMQEKGYKEALLNDSLSFGLIHKDIIDGEWDNFRVQLGTNSATIKINDGVAIDKNGNILKFSFTDNITSIPNDSQWRWIRIEHQVKTTEDYLVSISNTGSLSGINSKFLEVLRGESNNSVKISFPLSSQNTREYSVLEVISDTEAVLTGDFIAESNVRIAIVGSHTPDVPVGTDKKFPYQYDSSLLTYVVEVTPNVAPALVDGEQFYIARVRRSGVNIEIQDMRSRYIWKTKSNFDASEITNLTSPCAGVEAIKFDSLNSTRTHNLVYVSHGFRSSNWTANSSSNTITLLSGNGGKYKTTADYQTNDFVGWRVYFKSGKYAIIKATSTQASQINIIVDSLDMAELNVDLTQELHIVPNADSVEWQFTSATANILGNKVVSVPINSGVTAIPVEVLASPSIQYVVKYRFNTLKTWSAFTVIPDSTYLPESQFDSNGVQTGIATVLYTAGLITLEDASNSYINVVGSISTGQLYGVDYVSVNTASDPVTRFVVGTRREYVVVTNDDDLDASDADFGTPYNLTADAYFDLRSDLPSTIKNGNSFIIQIRGSYALSGFTWRIVQNFINAGNPGAILYTITDADLSAAKVDGLLFIAKYDASGRWFVKKISDNADATDWADITLANGWTVSGSNKAQWRRVGTQVSLRGQIVGTAASNAAICAINTVPDSNYIIGLVAHRLNTSTLEIIDIAINTSGQITSSDRINSTLLYLDGISYWTDPII